MSAAALDAARTVCIECLPTPEVFSEALTSVTQCTFDAVHANEMDVAAEAISLLFDMSCSSSGTHVHISGSPSGRSAVLILGFAGSSVPVEGKPSVLKPVIDMYEHAYPGWRVIATTGSGLCTDPRALTAFDAQLDKIVQAISGVRKILVHCMSNNGQGLWSQLLHERSAQLHGRVAAMIYDCAAKRNLSREPCDHDEAEQAAEEVARIVSSTVFMPLMSHSIEVMLPGPEQIRAGMRAGDAFRAPILLACRHFAKRKVAVGKRSSYFWANRLPSWGEWPAAGDGVADVFSYDAYSSPPVPTLCLTGPGDVIITSEDVSDWLAYLRKAAPAREVTLATLKGTHCMLMQAGVDRYVQEVRQLVTAAAMDVDGAPRVLGYEAPEEGSMTALGELLAAAGLPELARLESLRDLPLEDACEIFISGGRTALIAKAKAIGVCRLPDRQSLATAVGKHVKSQALAEAG